MKLGYACVSTDEQSLAVQVEQLRAAGCSFIFEEKASGKTAQRRQLETMLVEIEEWQRFQPARCTVVVTKLDRLARSTSDLLQIVARIGAAGASFVSLAEPWADTTSPAGTLIMTVFAGVAQFERERMLERCNAGRARAKRDGVQFGRKRALTRHQETLAISALKRGELPSAVARDLGVSRATMYRFKRQQGI